MKRFLCVLLILLLLLPGCAAGEHTPEAKQYTATFLTLFDTLTTIKGPAENEEAFSAMAQQIYNDLEACHQLFDIYNSYDGIHNLKTVNDMAGKEGVVVDQKIIDLLLDCKQYYALTGGKVNVAMGSVLRLWHEARNDSLNRPDKAYLPDMAALQEAAKHCEIDAVVIDEAASTVYITDPAVSLDVGAIAKGWAAEYAARKAPEGFMLSVGGNVRATGPKFTDGTPWVVGVTDPRDANAHLHTLYLTQGSLVTSGDYQRVYYVEENAYHHIIDPETLYPSEYWSSVTIVADDSGLADALSTALFLMPQEEGQELLDLLGAEALWVDRDGNLFYSPGFQDLIRT